MRGVGLAAAINTSGGEPLAALAPLLARLATIGCSHVELPSKSLGVIIGGELQPRRLAALQAALADRTIGLTVHGSRVATARVGNLLDLTTSAQRAAVAADLALAAAIGAEVLVYHGGILRDPASDDRALAAGLAAEREALRALGDTAAQHGIRIAVENLDPVGSYILRRGYGLHLDRLAEQIAAVDHPAVGICLDLGHAFLAARYLQTDYLAGVRAVAPLVNHLHISDNLGQVQLEPNPEAGESLIMGDGDLHLPPGWGNLPLAEALAVPYPRDPIALIELRADFAEHAAEAVATVRALLPAVVT